MIQNNITDLMLDYKACCLSRQEVIKDFVKDFGGKRLAKKELEKRLNDRIKKYEWSWINLISMRSSYESLIRSL